MDLAYVGLALVESWCIKTSTKWTEDCPAAGQCGVTALVVQDSIGGKIVKTYLDNGWHFYNKIGDTYIDFTASQFDKTIVYDHIASNRQEAFADTNNDQYHYLTKAMSKRLFNYSER